MTTKDKLLDTVKRYRMLAPGETVAVGCSGGADSLCLLSILYECAAALEIRVTAVHVHHGIRGAEADADEAFVRAFCEQRGIPLAVYHVDIPRMAAETGESTELCARRARYECFEKTQADKIATAHTATDAAETLLMHLSRGSGLHGLCGIPPVRGKIIRPLIDCFRAETEAYCDAAGIGYVTDSSNLSNDYTRNRLRHTVMPALREIYPAFEKNALRCTALLRADDAYLAEAAKRSYERLRGADGTIDCRQLSEEPPALRRRVIAALFAEGGAAEAEARHILLAEARLASPRFALDLPGGATAEIRDGRLFVRPRAAAAEPPAPTQEAHLIRRETGGAFPFGRYLLEIFPLPAEKKGDLPKNQAFFVDFSKIDAIIELRGRAAGDRIALAGRGCSKTLKKLWNEQKIPPEARDAIPVLSDSRGVIFTPPAGVDAARLPGADAKMLLCIKIHELSK